MEVAVALCTYNGADYLESQLTSILQQTRKVDEIVISDDGSVDGTFDIIEEYWEMYPDIISVLRNDTNLGIVGNFERAIKECSGEYIALADQDDIWNEEKIERQLRALSESNKDFVCHNSRFIGDREGTLWESLDPPFEPSGRAPKQQVHELAKRNFVQGATILMHRDFATTALPLPEVWPHDYYLALTAAMLGEFWIIDEALLQYRIHEDQNTGISNESNIWTYWQSVAGSFDHSRAAKWERMVELVADLPRDELATSNKWLKNFTIDMAKYEALRSSINSSNTNRKKKLYHFGKCFLKGYYWRFGSGILTASYDCMSLTFR